MHGKVATHAPLAEKPGVPVAGPPLEICEFKLYARPFHSSSGYIKVDTVTLRESGRDLISPRSLDIICQRVVMNYAPISQFASLSTTCQRTWSGSLADDGFQTVRWAVGGARLSAVLLSVRFR